MLLFEIKNSKIWKLTMFVSLIFLFPIFLRYENLELDEERKFIRICLNKQEFKNKIALWTLLTEDVSNYGAGAIKLLQSIKENVKITKFDAYVLELKQKPLPTKLRKYLERTGWRICKVNGIAPRDVSKTFNRFRDQFTKLLLWNAIEYTANYYFDSDTFVIRNIDNYLAIHQTFNSSLHKIGCTRDIYAGIWISGFNMGVFVIKPNQTEYYRLLNLKSDPNFYFDEAQAEQGFLNVVYKNLWYEIGFENNANLAVYSLKRDYWDNKTNFINIIHYTMEKPWKCSDVYKAPCDLWIRSNFTRINN